MGEVSQSIVKDIASQEAAVPADSTEAAELSTGDSVNEKGQRVYEPGKDETKKIDFSARFAALTKREKDIIARDKALKEKEAELSAWKKAQENAKKDPLAFMEAHGLSYDELTNFLLEAKDATKEPSADDKIRELEERLEADRRERAERETKEKEAEAERIIGAYKQKIADVVEQSPDDYEMIRLTENFDLVYEVSEEYFNETGKVLAPEDAARQVEEFLTREAQEKILKAKKFQKADDSTGDKARNPFQSYVDRAEAERQRPKESAPTLTNDHATSGGIPVNPDVPSWVDAEESKRRAAAFLQAQLSKG